MNNLLRVTRRALQCRFLHQTPKSFGNNLYEPDYLEAMKSNLPMYDTLNIQIRGYDYAILENYQKFIHKLLRSMDISVEEAWATPHQDIQVTTYKPKSEIINTQYNLKHYDRTVQITDVLSTQLPVILRALEASTPSGITVHVRPHEEWDEEIRYVPDTELKQLKQELDDLGGPLKKK
ncbi:large ribosomal subunit protein mL48 [Tribolium castaneum]|uniref:39S ribosomal protein L48, mitochondrial-like Protein n=1 Tax=Tribolium castaneum TaxID=7070 RepID=D2A319_TRICA|nr:PREDICTED: 39S ribosomal protein L48, mitochondrial [Tribolium castaneum]EFA01967.1 39S ribosomal protein L48, mitochondrial-like Protein [Tribolium castaneum]|eukprot:XP_973422.1 PREDICTED: 39S ribosomal protein L48, mitochondrial [Tribolium castaneum]